MDSHIFLMLIIGPSFRLPSFCLPSVFLSTSSLFFFITTNNFWLLLFYQIQESPTFWSSLAALPTALGNGISMCSLQITLLLCMGSQALGKYSMALLAFSKKTSFHLDKNKGWDNWLPAESSLYGNLWFQNFLTSNASCHLFIAYRGSMGYMNFIPRFLFLFVPK